MKEICEKYIKKLETATSDMVSATLILFLGKKAHLSFAKNPNATIYIGAGSPDDPNSRVIKFAPTHRDAQKMLEAHPNLIPEIFLTTIIQDWFSFLSEIYLEVITRNYFNSNTYKIPETKVTVNFELDNKSMIEELIKSAVKEFEFNNASKKLKIIRKIFNLDISYLENDLRLLKTNIQVRNMLQHNNGIITQKDLDDLGSNYIEVDNGENKKKFTIGQRITRTAYDIENLVNSIIVIVSMIENSKEK